MLNDLFITRDVVGFLVHYLDINNLTFPDYREKLSRYSSKQLMSYEQWWGLLDELQALCGEKALGLEIGRCVKVEHCGVLGYLFRTSRNVGEALSCFKRFERILYAGSQTELQQIDRETVSLVWSPEFGYSSQLSDELLLATIVSITREITHPSPLRLLKVDFTQAIDVENLDIYESFFACEVNQRQEKLSLTFSSADLENPIPYQDQTLHGILGKQAEEILKTLPESDLFLVEVRDTIIRCLHEGISEAPKVAAQMNISERTLHRRLKEKQRVFRDVLQDIRKSMAISYLSDNKITLTEVALLLGYSEQSAFSRAFRQWYGCAPLKYKQTKLNN